MNKENETASSSLSGIFSNDSMVAMVVIPREGRPFIERAIYHNPKTRNPMAESLATLLADQPTPKHALCSIASAEADFMLVREAEVNRGGASGIERLVRKRWSDADDRVFGFYSLNLSQPAAIGQDMFVYGIPKADLAAIAAPLEERVGKNYLFVPSVILGAKMLGFEKGLTDARIAILDFAAERTRIAVAHGGAIVAEGSSSVGLDELFGAIQQKLELKFLGSAAKLFYDGIYDFSEVQDALLAGLAQKLEPGLKDLETALGRPITHILPLGLAAETGWIQEPLAKTLNRSSVKLSDDSLPELNAELPRLADVTAVQIILSALKRGKDPLTGLHIGSDTPVGIQAGLQSISSHAGSSQPVAAPREPEPKPPPPPPPAPSKVSQPESKPAVPPAASVQTTKPEAPKSAPPPPQSKTEPPKPAPQPPKAEPTQKQSAPQPTAPQAPKVEPQQKQPVPPSQQGTPPAPRVEPPQKQPAGQAPGGKGAPGNGKNVPAPKSAPVPPVKQPSGKGPAQPPAAVGKGGLEESKSKPSAPIPSKSPAPSTAKVPAKPEKADKGSEPEKKEGSNRSILIAIAVLAVVAGIVFLMFMGGSDDPFERPTTSTEPPATASRDGSSTTSRVAGGDSQPSSPASPPPAVEVIEAPEGPAPAIPFAATRIFPESVFELATEPEPTTGNLSLTSVPEGAEVQLNGEIVGTTPLDLVDLEPGEHSLRLSLNGYDPIDLNAFITAGETTTLRPQALRLKSGDLRITSTPIGVRFQLRPRDPTIALRPIASVTPATVENLPLGAYSIIYERAGWPELTKDVTLTRSRALVESILTFPSGKLTVTSEPPGAKVLHRDEEIGVTPLTLDEVPPGPIEISAILERFSQETKTAEIAVGSETTLHFELVDFTRVFSRAQVDTQPEPVTQVAPSGLPRLVNEETVVVRCIIDEEGVPTNLEIISSTNTRLNKVVTEAVEQWRFKPATFMDRPVRTEVDIPFRIPPSRY